MWLLTFYQTGPNGLFIFYQVFNLILQSAKEKYFACKIALLNFADYLSPGGRYLQGATAQEEILCHQSNLYQIISNFNKYYEWNNQHINYHLYRNRAIYSPNVVFTNLDGN